MYQIAIGFGTKWCPLNYKSLKSTICIWLILNILASSLRIVYIKGREWLE